MFFLCILTLKWFMFVCYMDVYVGTKIYIFFFTSVIFIVILFSESNNFEDVPVIPAPGAPAVAPPVPEVMSAAPAVAPLVPEVMSASATPAVAPMVAEVSDILVGQYSYFRIQNNSDRAMVLFRFLP